MAEKALDFDSIDDLVNCGSGASLDDIAPITIEAWIYPTGWGEGTYGRIVEKGDAIRTAYLRAAEQSLMFLQGFSTTLGAWRTPDNSITLDEWNYIAITYDRSSPDNNPIIYINGVSVEVTEISTPEGTATSDAAEILYIGGNAVKNRTFDGIIDEVRISNVARTQEEITATWNDGNGVQFEVDGDTAALWHMNEGEGGTIYDETENDNDGTIDGASWVDGFPFSSLKTSSDTGSGVDAVVGLLAIITGSDTGSALEESLRVIEPKDVFAGDDGFGFDALRALIETGGSDMRLHTSPGQVRIPSKGVNL